MISDSAPMLGQVFEGTGVRVAKVVQLGNCVEVADFGRDVRSVRNSKDPTASALTFTAGEWIAFTTGICAGESD